MIASRLARRVLTHSVRPVTRVSVPSGRRFASTSAGHATKQSSDTPWIIGSALVFGPVIAYLLFGAQDKAKHPTAEHHAKPQPSISTEPPAKEAEEEPASSEVDKAAGQEVASDSPKDAQAAEETDPSPVSEDGKVHGSPALTDSEGNTASAEEIDASFKQAFKSNIPQDAQLAEAHDTTYGNGAPGQTEEAENKPDQKEKPGSPHEGTFQEDGESGPTDLGDAREGAKSQQAPKQASQK
ncbi:hypothetical protein C8Q74DRAFT_1353864 [Fomes fomentarius]|nr:hypothetical protein C8Q74DRAFT_1353864 [Fomes fomentarius]